ncbi:hypothetical protein V5O48_004146 [Marasmius crinis-equi]|uniref:Uncharacterized protein n=1 Tax=Marasmius crinis-equi TaxID=585013 RepID=A0ABR3FQW6_9AGAR
MSISRLARDHQAGQRSPLFIAVHRGTKRKLLPKEASFEAFERVVKAKFAIDEDTKVIMETKDYDICENQLYEIDSDVFPIIAPSLRSISLTVDNDIDLDIFGNRVEPCMGLPRLIQGQGASSGNVATEEKQTSPIFEDATTHAYPPDTTEHHIVQHAPANEDERLTVRVLGPPGDKDQCLTLIPSTLTCCIVAKIRKKYNRKRIEITHLAIPKKFGEHLIPCDIHATAMEVGLTHGDRVKLVLHKAEKNAT